MTAEAQETSGNLKWLLEDLVTRVHGTHGAVLLSADGLATAAHGVDREQAERLAAIAANMCSTARAAALTVRDASELQRVLTETADTLIFVTMAGESSVLAVTAGKDASSRAVGHEMAKFVSAVQPFLATPARGAPGFRGPGISPS